jgi:peptidase E
MGGGGFSMEPENTLLDDYLLSLVEATRPRVCFVPTASGDADAYVVKFYTAFARRAEASHLALFYRTGEDIEALLMGQDIIYVGGGNTANMLGIWRTHGVDRILRAAWEAGVVLAGLSAGSICWFEAGPTDSFGPDLVAIDNGLGFLSGSHCPHYDGEAQRRPTYHRQVAERSVPAGYAADDGAALVFDGTDLREVVASRPAARAYRVELVGGDVRETELPTRYLG